VDVPAAILPCLSRATTPTVPYLCASGGSIQQQARAARAARRRVAVEWVGLPSSTAAPAIASGAQ